MIIAQCSASKAPGSQLGMDKYQNREHDLIRQFMHGKNGNDGGYMAGWDWGIMSAKHGIVSPVHRVDDYDEVLTSPRQIPPYLARHAKGIREAVLSNEAAHDGVKFLGGKLYLEALRAALPELDIEHIGEGGKGNGDYFSAAKHLAASHDEDA